MITQGPCSTPWEEIGLERVYCAGCGTRGIGRLSADGSDYEWVAYCIGDNQDADRTQDFCPRCLDDVLGDHLGVSPGLTG